MALEEIIEQILSLHPNLTREEVAKRIEEKKALSGRLFTDEVAARIVASELGIDVSRGVRHPEISIRNLVSGLNDVTVTGRVITVYPIQAFKNPNGTEGRLARLLIADRSGTLIVVLWNAQLSFVMNGQIKQGQVIRVSHGYVREGNDGKLELHVGSRGKIQTAPVGIKEDEYPPVSQFIKKIKDIIKKHKMLNLAGVVWDVSSVSTFQRKDKTVGKVMRLKLRDETGQIAVVAWNEKVDELSSVKKGDCLQIMNAKVKERLDGSLEIHVEKATSTEIFPKQKSAPPQPKKVKDLKEGCGPVEVDGTVVTKPMVREVATSRGEKVIVATFELADETGKIWASMWRKLAEEAKNLSTGTKVKIKNAYVRKGFADQLEIVSRGSTSIVVLSTPAD